MYFTKATNCGYETHNMIITFYSLLSKYFTMYSVSTWIKSFKIQFNWFARALLNWRRRGKALLPPPVVDPRVCRKIIEKVYSELLYFFAWVKVFSGFGVIFYMLTLVADFFLQSRQAWSKNPKTNIFFLKDLTWAPSDQAKTVLQTFFFCKDRKVWKLLACVVVDYADAMFSLGKGFSYF